MESKGINASITHAIGKWILAEPGQNCVCWNDHWENCFVIGTVRKRITVETIEGTELRYEVQSALTGCIIYCSHALFYDGPIPQQV